MFLKQLHQDPTLWEMPDVKYISPHSKPLVNKLNSQVVVYLSWTIHISRTTSQTEDSDTTTVHSSCEHISRSNICRINRYCTYLVLFAGIKAILNAI